VFPSGHRVRTPHAPSPFGRCCGSPAFQSELLDEGGMLHAVEQFGKAVGGQFGSQAYPASICNMRMDCN
jgi:hypothetical protein